MKQMLCLRNNVLGQYEKMQSDFKSVPKSLVLLV